MLEFTEQVVGKVQVQMEITQSDVENVIVSSFEGGSNYWLALDNTQPEWADKPKGEPLSTWATKLLLDGKTVHLYDREDPEERWEMTLEKVINGIQKYVAKGGRRADKDYWDAESADCIMQYGLFDKIVYG
ncbi:hypothetical protein V7094_29160 [Priestia megaterium]|uniref:hypothetical protein n=1 Tax=Priestia megaterium TaxID=1404 RepID=UPI00300095D8